MSTISRRTALLGGAAALTTAATVAPVALKAGAVRKALAGPDGRLDALAAAWREAERAFGAACTAEDEARGFSGFSGIDVIAADGTVHRCQSENEIHQALPRPFPLFDYEPDDVIEFIQAVRAGDAGDARRAALQARYPDRHAARREAEIARLEKAEDEAEEATYTSAYLRAHAEWERASEATSQTWKALFDEPAQTVRGVLVKVRTLREDIEHNPDECLDAIEADLKRLAGGRT